MRVFSKTELLHCAYTYYRLRIFFSPNIECLNDFKLNEAIFNDISTHIFGVVWLLITQEAIADDLCRSCLFLDQWLSNVAAKRSSQHRFIL